MNSKEIDYRSFMSGFYKYAEGAVSGPRQAMPPMPPKPPTPPRPAQPAKPAQPARGPRGLLPVNVPPPLNTPVPLYKTVKPTGLPGLGNSRARINQTRSLGYGTSAKQRPVMPQTKMAPRQSILDMFRRDNYTLAPDSTTELLGEYSPTNELPINSLTLGPRGGK